MLKKLLLTSALVLPVTANAAEIAYWKTSNPKVPATIRISGKIVPGDSEVFSAVAAEVFDAIPESAKGTDIILDGPGGSVLAGLEIGRRIRSLGFRTIVDGRCTSICAMIWLAGVTRGVFAGARIGFHAACACLEDGCETSGVGNALIGAYLNQLGFDFPAVRYFTEAPPTSVRWLTAEKAREFNISIIKIDDSGQPAPTPEKKAYRIKLDDFPTTQRND